MSEHGSREIVRIHPAVAEEFRRVTKRLGNLVDESNRLAAQLQDEKKAREALGQREVDIDDMPGKQMPFRYQINIPLIGGSSSPVTGTFNVSRDGPFICRRIYASLLVTDAPLFEYSANNADDYTHFIGRYVPLTSSSTYKLTGRVRTGLNVGDLFIGGWAEPAPYLTGAPEIIAPPLDFEWEYNDSGGKITRQDKPISGDILARNDDDGYVMNNEVFPAGTTVNFIVSPTRPVTIIEGYNFTQDVPVSGPIDVELQVAFDGFKVLQPWVSWEL